MKNYLSGQYSYSVLAKEYGLASRFTVASFLKWYRKNYDIESMAKLEKLAKEKELTSEEELAIVKRQLATARLRIEGLETLIKVAEEELKIDIRKKPGTKPSKY